MSNKYNMAALNVNAVAMGLSVPDSEARSLIAMAINVAKEGDRLWALALGRTGVYLTDAEAQSVHHRWFLHQQSEAYQGAMKVLNLAWS